MKLVGKTTSAEALLAMLSLCPMSGYELRTAIEGSIGNFWSESFGQIYPTLKRLQTQGLISASDGPRSGTTQYTLTEAGWKWFREWLGGTPQPQVMRNDLLLKLFFGNHGQHAKMREHVEQEKRSLQANLERYKAIEARLHQNFSGHPGLPYWLLTAEYGKTEAEALIGWCDRTLATLQTMEPKREEEVP